MTLTSSKRGFVWTPEADAAFHELKRRFAIAPILKLLDPSCQFIVEVDAYDTGVGVVLSQRAQGDQKLHPCVFFCRRQLGSTTLEPGNCWPTSWHWRNGGTGWRELSCCSLYGLTIKTWSISDGQEAELSAGSMVTTFQT